MQHQQSKIDEWKWAAEDEQSIVIIYSLNEVAGTHGVDAVR